MTDLTTPDDIAEKPKIERCSVTGIDDLVKRLRHRASGSRGYTESIDWKAADALDRLWQEVRQRPVKPAGQRDDAAVSERIRTRDAAPTQVPGGAPAGNPPADAPEKNESPPRGPEIIERVLTPMRAAAPVQPPDLPAVSDDSPDAPATPVIPPRGPDLSQRALTLQEAADLLRLSRRTVYEHRDELGFFQIGSAWRVWPDKLREATAPTNSPQPTPKERESKPCRSENTKTASTTSISARQVASELDALLAQPTRRKLRNSTTR